MFGFIVRTNLNWFGEYGRATGQKSCRLQFKITYFAFDESSCWNFFRFYFSDDTSVIPYHAWIQRVSGMKVNFTAALLTLASEL